MSTTPPTREDELLTTEAAAMRLGLAPRTLETWRNRPPRDGGVPFVRVGGAIRYRASSISAYITAREVASTSDPGRAA